MTLNITVVTRRCIYQSADYRLIDLQSGRFFDFEAQKIVLINHFTWHATVCFCGVGRTTTNLDVSEWLAEGVNSIQMNDPFERLIEELMKASDWLSTVPPPNNRHSFSVGAFVGSKPKFTLITNFEQPSGIAAAVATPHLSRFETLPSKPKTFVSGQKQAVSRQERRWLASLAARDPEPERMYSALAEVNRNAAMRTSHVSAACFTTCVRFTGEGGGKPHGIGSRPLFPTFAIPWSAEQTFRKILDDQFGPGRAQLRTISTGRFDPSDEFYEIQLREKPNDASTHSNYGVYLKDKKGDLEGAEREYRKAIAIDGDHVNAIGNLANLVLEKGYRDQATNLYLKALALDPGNENVTWNYARLLLGGEDRSDREIAREALDRGISCHPKSGRLLMLRAELSLVTGNASEALEFIELAREKGAREAEVEVLCAVSLHLSGESVGRCIAAYRSAITLNAENGVLRLNLAQLMFINGDDADANKQLQAAMRLQLADSAQLEAQFYLLAHTTSDPVEIFETTKSLLARGGRLDWNIRPNIETVRRREPHKATLLELVSEVMAGKQDQRFLDQVLTRWPQKQAL